MLNCEKDKKYVVETVNRKTKSSYNTALESFGIPKTLYNEFICDSSLEEHQGYYKCEKKFDKKFFVKLAFALALPFNYAERLLNYNGYTLQSNGRQFDSICQKAFKIGFSRKMTIGLIDKKNAEMKETMVKFNPIPNLRKNRS